MLSIVNVVGSTIAKLSDDVLYTRAGPEIAVATTKGYTTQLAVLYLFAVYAAKVLGKIADEEYKKYISELCGLPKIMQAAIDGNKNIPELAKKISQAPFAFLHRQKCRLCGRNGRLFEAERDILPPFRSIRSR